MKIVFLSYLHGFGGAEKQNVMLANAMVESGHDVTLISISVDNNCYPLNKKIRYEYLPDKKINVLRIVTRYSDIKKKLKKLKPDITISFWFQSAYITALMQKSITGKVIYSERGDPGDKEYSGALGIVRALTLPLIDGFVFQSKGAKSYFNKKVQLKSVVIPNPVWVRKEDFPIIRERRKVIVTVGRLHAQKNHKLLIDSFAKIADDFQDYNLEIYGDGELREQLSKQIMNLGLSERIILKGTSKKIHSLIYDASLFVLTSDYEGLPNTLMEAMALGLPCISTDCRPGGARELINDGVDGIIVPCGNVNRLAEAMKKILADSNHAQMLSENAKTKMKKYSPSIIYDKWEDFFVNICNAKH